ncbi:unnamed protein product [Lactuca virosa]|uniref:Uncharacterized protein n=1 Tax=Lactuca virosa TaxID=75947 RepID=A0AAU9MC97_9ASTR|nr:unnamed protein product [Lactuca virosa]
MPTSNEQPPGGGGGGDINTVITPETSRIITTNAKRGYVTLSIPTCLRVAKAQSMDKEETREHTREVMELDRKHNHGTARARTARICNCPKNEDVNWRLSITVRVHNWQRLPQDGI